MNSVIQELDQMKRTLNRALEEIEKYKEHLQRAKSSSKVNKEIQDLIYCKFRNDCVHFIL